MAIQGKPPVVTKGQLAAGESIIIETSPSKGTVFMNIVTEAAGVATVLTTMDDGVISTDGLVFAAGVNSAEMSFSPLAALNDVQAGQVGPVTGVSIASAGGVTQYTISQFPRGVTP